MLVATLELFFSFLFQTKQNPTVGKQKPEVITCIKNNRCAIGAKSDRTWPHTSNIIQAIRKQSRLKIKPVNEIFGHCMTPGQVSPNSCSWIVLVEQMIQSLVVHWSCSPPTYEAQPQNYATLERNKPMCMWTTRNSPCSWVCHTQITWAQPQACMFGQAKVNESQVPLHVPKEVKIDLSQGW